MSLCLIEVLHHCPHSYIPLQSFYEWRVVLVSKFLIGIISQTLSHVLLVMAHGGICLIPGVIFDDRIRVVPFYYIPDRGCFERFFSVLITPTTVEHDGDKFLIRFLYNGVIIN